MVGTSARERRIPWPLLDARQCAERMATASSQEQVAVLFGREDRGLTNEELQVCNLHLNIPTSQAYSSLNLAMAVQIVAYELHMQLASPESSGVEAGILGCAVCFPGQYGAFLHASGGNACRY